MLVVEEVEVLEVVLDVVDVGTHWKPRLNAQLDMPVGFMFKRAVGYAGTIHTSLRVSLVLRSWAVLLGICGGSVEFYNGGMRMHRNLSRL